MEQIIYSAQSGDIGFFKTISKGLLLKARDNNGYTALDCAIMNFREDCCKEICRKCPELVWDQKNGSRHSALHHAASRGNVNMATCVIDAATKVPAKDDIIIVTGGRKVPRRILRLLDVGNHSPLWYAVHNNRYDATKFFLELDYEFVLGTDSETASAIAVAKGAANRGDHDAVRILDLLKRRQNYRSNVGLKEHNWTELHKATSRGDVDAVKKMIESNSKQIDAVDDEKKNFVHLAAQFGHIEIIKFVLEEVDIATSVFNAQDIYGNTPLHAAVLCEKQNIALCLLYDDRVKKTTVNTKGKMALDLVRFELI